MVGFPPLLIPIVRNKADDGGIVITQGDSCHDEEADLKFNDCQTVVVWSSVVVICHHHQLSH